MSRNYTITSTRNVAGSNETLIFAKGVAQAAEMFARHLVGEPGVDCLGADEDGNEFFRAGRTHFCVLAAKDAE